METMVQQGFYPRLAGGAVERSNKCVPLKCNFRVGRQAGNIGQMFRFRDGPFVERRRYGANIRGSADTLPVRD
jgi:hypothetical protein